MSTDSKDKKDEATIVETVQPNETALSLIVKAEIDSQISTAKAFPRSIHKFQEKVMAMATLNEEVAESCTYALPRGGKTIEGPSVRLAEIIAAAYGNLRSGARVIFNDGKTVTAQGIVHDLENNILHTEEVQRSIMQHEWEPDPNNQGKRRKSGRMIQMNEDMQVVAGRAACAIAYRNAIFKVVPAVLIEVVYQKIKQVARGDESTLATRREKAIKFFKEQGAKEERIFAKLGVTGIEDIDLDKLQILSGMKSAFVNKEATLDDLFAPDQQEKGKTATDDTLAKLKGKKGAVEGTGNKMENDLNKEKGKGE